MAGGFGGDSGALARPKKEPKPRPPRKLRRARSGGLASRDEVGTCGTGAAVLSRANPSELHQTLCREADARCN